MPKRFARNRRTRKAPRRSSAGSRQMSTIPRAPAGTGSIHSFHREWLQATLTPTAGSPLLQAVTLGISTFPSAFSAFLESFDLVQFLFVDVSIVPAFNVNTTTATSAQALPLIAWYPNYDDNVAPASYDAVAGIGNARQRLFDRPIHQRCAVNFLMPVNTATAGAVNNAVVLQAPWLNPSVLFASSALVPLLKFAVQATASVNNVVNIQMRITFRVVQAAMG